MTRKFHSQLWSAGTALALSSVAALAQPTGKGGPGTAAGGGTAPKPGMAAPNQTGSGAGGTRVPDPNTPVSSSSGVSGVHNPGAGSTTGIEGYEKGTAGGSYSGTEGNTPRSEAGKANSAGATGASVPATGPNTNPSAGQQGQGTGSQMGVGTSGGTTSQNLSAPKPASIPDGLVMQGSTVFFYKNGVPRRIDRETRLSEGITVDPNGRITLKDGTRTRLSDGQMVTLDGHIQSTPANLAPQPTAEGTNYGSGMEAGRGPSGGSGPGGGNNPSGAAAPQPSSSNSLGSPSGANTTGKGDRGGR